MKWLFAAVAMFLVYYIAEDAIHHGDKQPLPPATQSDMLKQSYGF